MTAAPADVSVLPPTFQGRLWCFTLNNPTQCLDASTWPDCTYCVYQPEIGESNTYHFQGYVEFSTRKRRNEVTNIPDLIGAHVEPKVKESTRAQARFYCMDPSKISPNEEIYEYGVWIPDQQGARNDIIAMKALIDSGGSEREVYDQYPQLYMRYQRGIVAAMKLQPVPERAAEGFEVTLCVGRAGVGKTTWVQRELSYRTRRPGFTVFWPPRGWMDGYSGETCLVFDEFHGGEMRHSDLKKLLQPAPLRAGTKGGHVDIRATIFYFTTNSNPR